MNKKGGFTIIELLVIVAIFGLFSSIALANFQGSRDRAKRAATLVFQSSVNSSLGAETAAAWNFEEGAQGSPATTIPDTSGSNQTGYIVGAPPGTATYVQGMDTGNGVLLNGAHIGGTGISTAGNNAVTVAAWVNPTSVINTTNIFRVGDPVCNSFRMGISSGNLMVGNQDDQADIAFSAPSLLAAPGGFTIQTLSNSAVQNNKWQFVVSSFDPSGEVRTYIDGVMVATITGMPTSSCSPDSAEWAIGGAAPGFATNYNGRVDNVTVYYASLTPTTVSQLYQDELKKRAVATN